MEAINPLNENRQALKRRLASGEYRTLVDVVLDWASLRIKKVGRNPQPISPWYTATFLYLLILLISFIGLFLLGEGAAFKRQFETLSAAFVPVSFLLGYFNVLSIVAGNVFIHRVFTVFHESVIDAIESFANLEDFERWLAGVCDQKKHFVFSVIGGFFVGIYQVWVLAETGINVLVSTAIGTIMLNTFSVVFLYLLVYMIMLSARIGKYRLRLLTIYPANSDVINRLSGLLMNFVYLVSFYAAILTLSIAIQQLLIALGAVVVFLFWLPIIGMFILNQNSLSRIIQRSKLDTLNGIQIKIEQLHFSEKFGEIETMDTLNRLIDYYDRIRSTRNSRVDSEAILNLINSLLLPVLALVLGNIDSILSLLR